MRQEKKYHFIYKTTNNLNGRYYYGMHSTDDLTDGYFGSGTYLRRAIKKYGKENFKVEILEFCKNRKNLKLLESKIVTLQEIANVECMNLRVGGSGPLKNYGYTMSSEIRIKISKNNARYWTGKHRSDTTKQKISDGNIGKKLNDETKKKISKSLKGKYIGNKASMYGKIGELNPFFGKTHTHTSIEKIKKARSKQIFSEETKNKISNRLKKIILQFTLDGEFVAEYPSRNDAAKSIGINPTNISNHINDKKKSAGGYFWKYK